MSSADSTYHGDEIAIIGLSGRFPGASDVEQFWRNLCDGIESITFLSDQELASSGVDPDLLNDPTYVKARGVLDDVELFDAGFFGFTPREAEIMDPQQRVFLECAWEALEHAGYAAETQNSRVGVYASASMSSYALNLYANSDLADDVGIYQLGMGNDKDFLSTRVSYKLNLQGPSVTVQTACSSSLVAVHLACQGLLSGECELALAGGISISGPQKAGYLYQEGGIASPDGHCRAFDAQAQGTVSGCGIGLVVLKPLSAALADGDRIYAIIKGSTINNDGAAKIGYTAPSVQGQAQAIAGALTLARVAPETISYIEAHGTGTPLGDPIEIAALTRVFRAKTDQCGFCAIGSVKTNIGHLDAAAGVTGLIKTVLALQHKLLPASLHFESPNPQIDFANSPFYVNTTLARWPAGSAPRRAGVSSFGIGGTNAHVVLEEAPAVAPSGASRPWQLLLLSAKTSAALAAASAQLADHLKRHPEANIADVAYTLQVGRRAFSHRLMLVCHDPEDALNALEAQAPDRVLTDIQETRDRPVVFLFPGQGAQYAQMARGLYDSEPAFREQVDRCAELLIPHLGLDLREVLYPQEQRTQNKEQNREHQPEEPRTKNQEPTTGHRPPATDPSAPLRASQRTTTNTDGTDTIYRVPNDDQRRPSILRLRSGQATDLGPTSDSARPLTRSPLHPLTPSLIPRLEETWLTQPALFVVEYALAKLWMAWGVRPQALIGHSVGEYVAACLAGVFSLEDALRLVAARGRDAAGAGRRDAGRLPAGAGATAAPGRAARAGGDQRAVALRRRGAGRCGGGPTTPARRAGRGLSPAAYFARLPLCYDGADRRAVCGTGAPGHAAAAQNPLRLQPDRHLDHGR